MSGGERTVLDVEDKIQTVRGSRLENQKLFYAGRLVLLNSCYRTNIYLYRTRVSK